MRGGGGRATASESPRAAGRVRGAPARASETGVPLADRVVVPPGQGALVRVLPAPQSPVGSYQLVTDAGIRYPVPTEEILGWLGYSAALAVELPVGVVQQLPAGPTLDPDDAHRPAVG